MSEYFTNLGRREELRRDSFTREAVAEGIRDSLRMALDPVAPVKSLDKDKIVSLAVELAEQIEALGENDERLEKIKKVIGK